MPNLRMPGKNFSKFDFYSSKAVPGICFLEYQWRMTTKLNWENNIVAVITHVDGDLKRQLKTEYCILLDCFY